MFIALEIRAVNIKNIDLQIHLNNNIYCIRNTISIFINIYCVIIYFISSIFIVLEITTEIIQQYLFTNSFKQ